MMRRSAVALVFVALVTMAGCRHRTVKAVAVAPAPPAVTPVVVSVPPPTHPTEPLPEPAEPALEAAVPVVTPPRKPHKKKVVQPPTPPVQVAAIEAPTPAAAPIALGQLSAGGDTGNGLRTETEQLLAAQKVRVERLPTASILAHPTEVEQARRFLKNAEDAWKTADVEGAHTLALKTKVLLDDVQK